MKTDRVLTMQECLDEWYVVPTRVNRPAITRMVDLASHVPAARADWSKLHKLLFADAISVSKNSGFADFPASVAEIAGLDDVKQNQLGTEFFGEARRILQSFFRAFGAPSLGNFTGLRARFYDFMGDLVLIAKTRLRCGC
jgi:hypothetical protein